MSSPPLRRIFNVLAIGTAIFMGLLLILVYFACAPGLNEPLVRSFLFYPTKLLVHSPALKSLAGVDVEELSIVSDGKNLNALFYRVPGANDVVLLSHGNAGHLDFRIKKIQTLIESGKSVLAYDYRGYGKSEGEPTLIGVVDDATAAYDYLVKDLKYKPDSIILYGESIGTGVSTELARMRPCKGLILESGFASTERLAKEKLPFLHIYPSSLMLHPAFDNLDYVRGKHPPVLLLAGKLDTTIPCNHSETMAKEATPEKMLVIAPNSSHNDFSQDMKLYADALAKYFAWLDGLKSH